ARRRRDRLPRAHGRRPVRRAIVEDEHVAVERERVGNPAAGIGERLGGERLVLAADEHHRLVAVGEALADPVARDHAEREEVATGLPGADALLLDPDAPALERALAAKAADEEAQAIELGRGWDLSHARG